MCTVKEAFMLMDKLQKNQISVHTGKSFSRLFLAKFFSSFLTFKGYRCSFKNGISYSQFN